MTAGFENHTPQLAEISLQDSAGNWSGNIQVQSSIMSETQVVIQFQVWREILGERTLTTAVGWLSKREAIYLRNRLTAFIEAGIGAEVEEGSKGAG
jgi:hypothetical protein